MLIATILLVLVFLIFDWALPPLISSYAIGVLPWGDKQEVEEFESAYKRRRPRRLLICSTSVFFMFIATEFVFYQDLFVILGVALAVIYVSIAGYDIFKANREVKSRNT